MDLGTILLVAIVLACPLMMLLMHREGTRSHRSESDQWSSLAELRRQREALDAEIASREGGEAPEVSGHDRSTARSSSSR